MEDRCATTAGKHLHLEYRYLTEFQSHDPEFDYLKSLEIEEKINKVAWVDRNSAAQFILSTNDKTVKLWKVTACPISSVCLPAHFVWPGLCRIGLKVIIEP